VPLPTPRSAPRGWAPLVPPMLSRCARARRAPRRGGCPLGDWSRHLRTKVTHSPCSRQSWASRFSPESASRATCRLNSRLKVRFAIEVPLWVEGRRMPLPLYIRRPAALRPSTQSPRLLLRCVSQLRGSPHSFLRSSQKPRQRPGSVGVGFRVHHRGLSWHFSAQC
jgi:hypothetical protein